MQVVLKIRKRTPDHVVAVLSVEREGYLFDNDRLGVTEPGKLDALPCGLAVYFEKGVSLCLPKR